MPLERAKLGHMDIYELAIHLCELPDDAEDDQIDQALYDKFEMNQDQLRKLVEVLMPLCEVGTSPLTGQRYRGFATEDRWLAKQDIVWEGQEVSQGASDEDQLRALREKALDGIAWELAHDNIGIYPQAIVGGPNAYAKRTERMEGHNECSTALIDYYSRIADWIEEIPAEHKTLAEDMLITEKLRIGCNNEISLWVNCSDLFFWACADGEDIELSELLDLAECYKLSPQYGNWLWCSRKRGMRPQTACYPYIPKEQWHLFDAAGPERDDPDGRGRVAL